MHPWHVVHHWHHVHPGTTFWAGIEPDLLALVRLRHSFPFKPPVDFLPVKKQRVADSNAWNRAAVAQVIDPRLLQAEKLLQLFDVQIS